MAHSHLPADFRTSMPSSTVLEVRSKDGEFLMMYDLESLAANLLNGTARARGEQAAAGAAIVHFLAHLKGL